MILGRDADNKPKNIHKGTYTTPREVQIIEVCLTQQSFGRSLMNL